MKNWAFPAVAFLALFAGGTAGFAPVPPPRHVVKSGLIASSKSDAHGLVTQLRPMVTRLAPEDPFRIALHWAMEKRPVQPADVAGVWRRGATLLSMTFLLTTPDGVEQGLKLEGKPADPDG